MFEVGRKTSLVTFRKMVCVREDLSWKASFLESSMSYISVIFYLEPPHLWREVAGSMIGGSFAKGLGPLFPGFLVTSSVA